MARDLIDDRLLDALSPGQLSVLAVRIDGAFRDLRLRSVHRQHPPYPPLAEVTAHQREWTVERATGSIVGLHVELPTGVGLGTPGAADRAAIARVEGGPTATG
jgi:alpha-acetolactate decarboxylase